ncbi:hypothetical protein LZ31DRAFT_146510 [Colletotrichum somersetense]|nr:hypothetical protein LZ31DRAFT_146510 [Colletotrichum somersetense]
MAPSKVPKPGARPGVGVVHSSKIKVCVPFPPPCKGYQIINQGPRVNWSTARVLSRISNALKPCTRCPESRQLRPRNLPPMGLHRPVPLGPRYQWLLRLRRLSVIQTPTHNGILRVPGRQDCVPGRQDLLGHLISDCGLLFVNRHIALGSRRVLVVYREPTSVPQDWRQWPRTRCQHPWFLLATVVGMRSSGL